MDSSKEEELKTDSVQAFMAGFSAAHEEHVSAADMYFDTQCRQLRGEEVKVTLDDASFYRGVFICMHESEDKTFCIFLKAADHYLATTGEPTGEFLMEVSVEMNHVSSIQIEEFNPFSLLARSNGGFLDSEVSGTEGVRMRDLQKWEMDASYLEGLDADLVANLDGLDDTKNISAEELRQDVRQLKEFDETQYTSVLNKTSAFYKQHRKKAEQIASNIMNTASTNPHTLEERNVSLEERAKYDRNQDEEAKYGDSTDKNVPKKAKLSKSENAWIPPHKRKATKNQSPGSIQSTPPTAAQTNKPVQRSSQPPNAGGKQARNQTRTQNQNSHRQPNQIMPSQPPNQPPGHQNQSLPPQSSPSPNPTQLQQQQQQAIAQQLAQQLNQVMVQFQQLQQYLMQHQAVLQQCDAATNQLKERLAALEEQMQQARKNPPPPNSPQSLQQQLAMLQQHKDQAVFSMAQMEQNKQNSAVAVQQLSAQAQNYQQAIVQLQTQQQQHHQQQVQLQVAAAAAEKGEDPGADGSPNEVQQPAAPVQQQVQMVHPQAYQMMLWQQQQQQQQYQLAMQQRAAAMQVQQQQQQAVQGGAKSMVQNQVPQAQQQQMQIQGMPTFIQQQQQQQQQQQKMDSSNPNSPNPGPMRAPMVQQVAPQQQPQQIRMQQLQVPSPQTQRQMSSTPPQRNQSPSPQPDSTQQQQQPGPAMQPQQQNAHQQQQYVVQMMMHQQQQQQALQYALALYQQNPQAAQAYLQQNPQLQAQVAQILQQQQMIALQQQQQQQVFAAQQYMAMQQQQQRVLQQQQQQQQNQPPQPNQPGLNPTAVEFNPNEQQPGPPQQQQQVIQPYMLPSGQVVMMVNNQPGVHVQMQNRQFVQVQQAPVPVQQSMGESGESSR